ncbi:MULTISPECIES: P-loop NTPase [Arthrobacter]|uniref:P-loop NTPase n=2 Tax=Arthrobacter TaxID=1663 RepID=A0ABU9KJV4_9MICC|nr:P-loop NTPase [Arthrobacter sp. YJM1]MDP5227225.1 P-loop NTPase [Arthrobacter sp. YJM1]
MTLGVAVLGAVPGLLVDELRGGRGGRLRIARECGSFEELMGACQAGTAQIALFLEGADSLDMTTVDRLRALGVAVVVLHGDPEERARLGRMGAVPLPLESDREQVEKAVALALGTDTGAVNPVSENSAVLASAAPVGAVAASWSHVVAAPAIPEQGARWRAETVSTLPDRGEAASRDPGEPGRAPHEGSVPPVLVVWSPVGSPGRTTVAVNLAAELALLGKRVVLVDADTYGAGVAATLGLLDESAGVAQACRLADLAQLEAASLERLCVPVQVAGSRLDVLSGITRPDRWTELRGTALTRVLDLCAGVYDHVVVDVSFCLESDEELSFDTMAPRRNAATLCALERADRVYVIGEGTALGVPRLVRTVPLLQELIPDTELVVLMNKIRAAAAGGAPERQVRDAWERFGPELPIAGFLPFRPDVLDQALRNGEVLAERAPESELRRALQSLVCAPAQQRRRSSVFYTTTRRWRSR